MNTFRVSLLVLLIITAVGAQEAAPPVLAAPPDPAATTVVSTQRTPEELEQLLGPIALYPDALIALILPASTSPTDIVLAARHLRDNPGDRSQIEHRAWEESVKSLTNYPEVITWMDENLHWTRQVGEAFATQPADVMEAIQRLRAKARAAGTLADTPQQQVIAEQQIIRIVPAQSNVIYVPRYEPDVVFVDQPVYYTRPFVTFGLGVAVGSWLAYDCDWRRHSIWVGDRHRRWTGHDWRRPIVPFTPSHSFNRNAATPIVRQWRPPSVPRITVTASNRFRSDVVRPAPFGFSSSRPHTFRDSGGSRSNSFRDSSAPGFRGSSAVNNRNRSVDNPPVVPAMPRNFSPGFRGEDIGPRAAAPVVAPPLPTAGSRINRLNTNPGPSVNVQPAPPPRRFDGNGARDSSNGSNGVRDYGNRSRSFRSSQPVVTAPLPVAPALPMATPSRNTQPMGPTVQRSFPRASSAPSVVPALPMQNQASRPAAIGPVAPQVTAPAPATAPQAAPVQRNGGEGRGQRGPYGGGRGRPSS